LERFIVNVDRYGNTSTASIPIAVCEAVNAGKIKPGNRIVLVGFGAGLTWGSAVIEWVIAGQAGRAPWWRSGFFIFRILARIRSWLLQAQRRVESFFWRG
jgi:3-oxoacyl-[acyl-carrier-protein] synthase-3